MYQMCALVWLSVIFHIQRQTDQNPTQLFFGKRKYSKERDGENNGDFFMDTNGGNPGWMGGTLI